MKNVKILLITVCITSAIYGTQPYRVGAKDITHFYNEFYDLQEKFNEEGLDSKATQDRLTQLRNTFIALPPAQQQEAQTAINEQAHMMLKNALGKMLVVGKAPNKELAPRPVARPVKTATIGDFYSQALDLKESYNEKGIDLEAVRRLADIVLNFSQEDRTASRNFVQENFNRTLLDVYMKEVLEKKAKQLKERNLGS